MSDFIAVTLTVHCDDDASAARAVEVLTRPLIGLALDDMVADVRVMKIRDDGSGDA